MAGKKKMLSTHKTASAASRHPIRSIAMEVHSLYVQPKTIPHPRMQAGITDVHALFLFHNRLMVSLICSSRSPSREGRVQLADRSYNPSAMKKSLLRGVVEVAFIVFLFYSNLLMGEFERSGMGKRNGLSWALRDVFTLPNLEIAIIASAIGYVLVEILRTRF